MTVLNETDWAFYDGNGVTTVFPIPFKLFAKEDARIVQIDADGVPTTLALTTDYTIPTADLGSTSGNATLLVAVPVGERLLVRRSRLLTQPTKLRDQRDYSAERHEDAIDALLMQTQGIQYSVSRALQFPETEEDAPDVAVLPSIESRANKYIKFDADGNPEYVTDAAISTSKLWTREGVLTTGSNDLFWPYEPSGSETYTRLKARVNVAPTGSPITVEILLNGVTSLGEVTILAGELSGLEEGLSIAIPDGEFVRPAITGVGSTIPGTTLAFEMTP